MNNKTYHIEGINNGLLLSGSHIWGMMYFDSIDKVLAYIKHEEKNNGILVTNGDTSGIIEGVSSNGKV